MLCAPYNLRPTSARGHRAFKDASVSLKVEDTIYTALKFALTHQQCDKESAQTVLSNHHHLRLSFRHIGWARVILHALNYPGCFQNAGWDTVCVRLVDEPWNWREVKWAKIQWKQVTDSVHDRLVDEGLL